MSPDTAGALAITVAPAAMLLAAVYPLRLQGGRIRPRPVSAVAILARLADEVDTGEIPRDLWGGADRPTQWTVPPRYATAERDLVGAFPVTGVAA